MRKLFPAVAGTGLLAIGLALGGCTAFEAPKTQGSSESQSAVQDPASDPQLEIKPVIAASTGLSGEPISYPEGEPEMRLLRVEFPVGGKVPLHTHPAPLIAYVSKGEIRHTRGDEINTFSPGQAFIESNRGGPHFVENVGKEPAVVFVAVASKKGLPTTEFVEPQQ